MRHHQSSQPGSYHVTLLPSSTCTPSGTSQNEACNQTHKQQKFPQTSLEQKVMPHACRRRVLGHSSESQAATPGRQYGVLWCIQIDSQSTYNISTHKHCLGTARRHTKPLETTQKVYRASHREYIGLDLTRGLHRRNTSCMPPSLVNITKAKNAAKPSPVKLSDTTHSTDPSHMV